MQMLRTNPKIGAQQLVYGPGVPGPVCRAYIFSYTILSSTSLNRLPGRNVMSVLVMLREVISSGVSAPSPRDRSEKLPKSPSK